MSCFDDKTTKADNPLAEIVIDTTGIPTRLPVAQYGRLQLSPGVSQEGYSDTDFSYKWLLSVFASTQQSSPSIQYIDLGDTRDLDVEITLPPNSTTYFLWYQVTNDRTGIRKDILWNVFVQPKYNEGLLIADTRDGVTTDLTLIEGKTFTINWTGEDRISRNVYSKANGSAFDGLITQILHSYNNGTRAKRFYCIGDRLYALLDGNEYELVGRDHEVVFDRYLDINPSMMMLAASQGVVMVNNGLLYFINNGIVKDYPSIPMPMSYNVTINDEQHRRVGEVDKYVAFGRTFVNNRPWGVWYDKNDGIFLCHLTTPSNMTVNITTLNYTLAGGETLPFDPNNVPGMETVYAAIGFNDNFYFVMRDVATGAYRIYTIGRSDSKPKAVYSVPGTTLDDAVGVTVAENANVVYFATRRDIYAIVLGGESPAVNKVYSIPSGEITHFSMFRQAWFLRNTFLNKGTLPGHEYMLLAGVWDGSGGTLHTIPIFSASAGTIEESKVETYTGFGKILTVVGQE
jgi:hypothetical protein